MHLKSWLNRFVLISVYFFITTSGWTQFQSLNALAINLQVNTIITRRYAANKLL